MKIITRISIALTLCALMIITFFAFVFSATSDIKGTQSSFSITQTPQNVSKPDLFSQIKRAADTQNLNVYSYHVDAQNPMTQGILIAFIGNQDEYNQAFPDNVARSFDREKDLKIHPYTYDETLNVQGFYESSGTSAQTQKLVKELEKKGFKATTVDIAQEKNKAQNIPSLQEFGNNRSISALVPATIILLAALVMIIVYEIGMSRKDYAVEELAGYTKSKIIGRVLRKTSLYYVACCILIAIIGVIFLFFYNRFTDCGSFAIVCLAVTLGLYIALMLMMVVALVVTLNLGLYRAIQGEKPYNFLSIFSFLAYVIIIILAFTSMGLGIDHTRSLIADTNAYSKWSGTSGYVNPLVGSDAGKKDNTSDLSKAEGIIKQADQDGKLIIAQHNSPQKNPNPQKMPDEFFKLTLNGEKNFQVNNQYLEKQEILDLNNQPIRNFSVQDKTGYLLIPEQYKDYSEVLISAYSMQLAQKTKYTDKPIDAKDIRIEAQIIKDNQRAFTYGQEFENTEWSIENPVIFVAPIGSNLIPLQEYVWGGSSGNVIFTDRQYAEQKIRDNNLQSYYLGFNNISQQPMKMLGERIQELTYYVIGMVLSLLFTLYAIILATELYTNRNRKKLFVERTNGYSWFKRYGRFMAVMVTIPVVVGLFWFLRIQIDALWIGFLLVALVALATFFVLRHFDKTMTSTTIKE